MAITEKKEKVINFGLTDELTEQINKWTERTEKEIDDKKPALEAKKDIVEMLKKEIEKINMELNKSKISDDEWYKLLNKVDKISDIIRFW